MRQRAPNTLRKRLRNHRKNRAIWAKGFKNHSRGTLKRDDCDKIIGMNLAPAALFLSTLLLGTSHLAYAAAEPQNPLSSSPQVGHSERQDTSPNLRDMPPVPSQRQEPCEMPLGRIPPPSERERRIPCRPGPGAATSPDTHTSASQPPSTERR